MSGSYILTEVMNSCVVCSGPVTALMPGLMCSGFCNRWLHARCNVYHDGMYIFTTGQTWTCRSCNATEMTHTDFTRSMNAMCLRYGYVQEGVNATNIGVAPNANEANESAFRTPVVNQLIATRYDYEQIKEVVFAQVHYIDLLERKTRMNDIEIMGVIEYFNEDLIGIVCRIAWELKCPILPTEIVSVVRTRAPNGNPPDLIVVTFRNLQKKEEIMAASRRYNGIPLSAIGFQQTNSFCVINEHLTNRNRILYMRAIECAKLLQFQYVWTANGIVFVKKNMNTETHSIISEGDLFNIFPNRPL